MSLNFSLSINGATPVSCSAAGWALGTFTRRNLDADSLTLSRVLDSGIRTAARSEHTIEKGDKVVLFLGEERLFTGTAQSPAQSYDDSSANTEVELLGPWWDLTRQTFVLSSFIGTTGLSGLTPDLGSEITITTAAGDGSYTIWNPALNDGAGGWEVPSASSVTYEWGRNRYNGVGLPTLDIAGITSSYGWLCGTRTFGGVTTLESVQVALWRVLEVTRLNMLSLGLDPVFNVDESTVFIPNLNPPVFRSRITHVDRKVSDLITELLAVMPDVCLVWDYSQEVPMMQFRRVSASTDRSYTLGYSPLASVRLNPLDSLIPRGVVIRYEVANSQVSGFNYPRRNLIYMEKWPEDTLMHDPGALCHTVPWSAGTYIPQGLAKVLYDSLSVLRTAGSITLRGLTPTQVLQLAPGLTVGIYGDTTLEPAQSLVQEVTWNIPSNTVTLKAGYPKRLGLDGLTDLRTYLVRVLNGVFDS